MRMSEADFARLAKGKKGKPKGPTETDIQNAIRDFLRWRGWFVIRHQQGLGSHKGLSDLTAIKNGRTVYIEVKNIFGKLSEKQIEFKSDIENHGGIYLVVRSIADIEAEFARYHL